MRWYFDVVLLCAIIALGMSTLTPPNGFILDDLGDDGFFISIAGRKIIEHHKDQPFISIGTGRTKYVAEGIEDKPGEQVALKYYRIYREENEIHITLTDNNKIHLTLTLLSDERNKLTIRFADFPKAFDRVWLRLFAETSERVYGGGQRIGTFNLRQQSFPIWSAGKTTSAESAYPMFTFVSSRLYYCSVSGHNYGRMDFTQTDRHELYIVGLPESINLNADVSFEKLMRKLTYFQGRPPTLPDWFGQGLLIGVQGGEAELSKQVELAAKHDIRVGGVLISDWSNGLGGKAAGVSDWSTNSALYSEWDKLVQKLKQQRIDVYGAISPFLVKGSLLFNEAQSLGHLVQYSNNDSYLIGGQADQSERGIVDLTSEAAYNWFKEVLKDSILKLSLRGWMADVGQGAPADGIYQSDESTGEGGAVTHNLYPLLWARVNRRACQEADPYAPQTPFPIVLPLETVFFTRAGTKDTTRVSPLSHVAPAGADFASLAGVLRAVLSLAVSGGGLSHFTLGWSLADQSGASEEVVLRAAELAVFSPVMRTEGALSALKLTEGGLKTLAVLVRMHDALHDYTMFSSQRFTREGVALVRPLVFYCEDADLPECATIDDQFFYGRDLLVAAVLEAGATDRRLYVPTGKWVYAYDSTHVLTGPTWVTVKAPIGRVPAFYRQESDWARIFEKFGNTALGKF